MNKTVDEEVKLEDKKEAKVELLELQLEAVKAQAFAQGYTAGLQFLANKIQGASNAQPNVEANKNTASASQA